jgi:hypothetical protein
MAQRHARIFQSLRSDVLERLIEVRGSIDHAYGRIPEETIREQFDVILDKMESYLASEDISLYRRFASRYVAMRVGEGFTHENLIHSVVAIGDVVVQVAKRKLGQAPECDDLVRAVVKMNFVNARMLVAFLAEDLAEREAQRQMLKRSIAP